MKVKKNAVILENYTYDFPENWEKWRLLQRELHIKNYLLCEKTNNNNRLLIFVNILQTALTIQNNYEKFREVVGYSFDPLSKIFELNEEASSFWDIVLNHSELFGLLMGFGVNNVWVWHWKYRDYGDIARGFQKTLQPTPSSMFDVHQLENLSINNFPIPSFVSFFKNNPIVNQYKEEREKIKKLYRGEEFVSLTLKKLTE